MAFHFIRIHT